MPETKLLHQTHDYPGQTTKKMVNLCSALHIWCISYRPAFFTQTILITQAVIPRDHYHNGHTALQSLVHPQDKYITLYSPYTEHSHITHCFTVHTYHHPHCSTMHRQTTRPVSQYTLLYSTYIPSPSLLYSPQTDQETSLTAHTTLYSLQTIIIMHMYTALQAT